MLLRSLIVAGLLLISPLGAGSMAVAQTYPDNTVRLVNPNSVGGVSDRMARIIAKAMEPSFGQTIIIDNKSGAASLIGINSVLNSKPNGYVVGQTCLGPVVILPLTGQKMPFDFMQDAEIVGMMGGLDVVIVARADDPVSTIEQLVEAAKAKPNQYAIGMAQSPANAIPLLYMEKHAGIQMKMVSYRGEVPALTDLLGGTLNYSIQSVGVAIPQIQAGKIKALQILSTKRSPALPDVPSLSDSKVEGFPPDSYCVMFVPKGTPQNVVDKLSRSLNAAAKDKDLIDTFNREGLIPEIGGTPEAATKFIRDVQARWVGVSKEVDLTQYR